MDVNGCYPRVLVVANNGFSDTSNNGRTLGNYFKGWPLGSIAQFCISVENPNYEICDNYYQVTDREAIHAFLHFCKARRVEFNEGNTIVSQSINNKRLGVKTPVKSILRYFIWSRQRWKSKEFTQWVDNFNPEIIVCYNSDSAFILDIARSISLDKKVPLVMINTEGYYFFKNNFMVSSGYVDKFIYPIYRCLYRAAYKKFMKHVDFVVYLNKTLQNDYTEEFEHKSDVIYTSTDIEFDANFEIKRPYVFSYIGNFGFNRWKALIDIAQVLNGINADFKLDIYGLVPSDQIMKAFSKEKAIELKGFVNYCTVKNIIRSSTILFHAEAQDKEFREALRYGFTTKLADSISSGHPFLMYSSPQIAGASYVISTGSGWHAKNKDELKSQILAILGDDKVRNKTINNAKMIAANNHNIERNRKKFHQILASVLKEKSYNK